MGFSDDLALQALAATASSAGCPSVEAAANWILSRTPQSSPPNPSSQSISGDSSFQDPRISEPLHPNASSYFHPPSPFSPTVCVLQPSISYWPRSPPFPLFPPTLRLLFFRRPSPVAAPLGPSWLRKNLSSPRTRRIPPLSPLYPSLRRHRHHHRPPPRHGRSSPLPIPYTHHPLRRRDSPILQNSAGALNFLSRQCDGDARIALNSLEASAFLAVNRISAAAASDNPLAITATDAKEAMQCKHVSYDRHGDEHYNLISALHKSMRGGDAHAAIYWLARMLEGGEQPLYIARRLVQFAGEDVELADPAALGHAVACYQACHFIGMPECYMCLAQCITYLSLAPKSGRL
ncbi:hypothetical protein KSP39_PZI020306 [Platanthera zijinensis]|uniref:UBA domain-containing protein n=1 Tax=Platanthera zijinensis TaxID=2320716 RepID=A0AAP0B0H9_9ASPA